MWRRMRPRDRILRRTHVCMECLRKSFVNGIWNRATASWSAPVPWSSGKPGQLSSSAGHPTAGVVTRVGESGAEAPHSKALRAVEPRKSLLDPFVIFVPFVVPFFLCWHRPSPDPSRQRPGVLQSPGALANPRGWVPPLSIRLG
jgi:hypothetical protein